MTTEISQAGVRMIHNSAVIATTAEFLADMLREKLHDVNFKVSVASNDKDLYSKINMTFPRLIFIEHCFHGHDTDDYIYKIMRFNQNLHIVIWAVCELNPVATARFIHAGAESYISFRDSVENIENILGFITKGKCYCPADVETALNAEAATPVVGKTFSKRETEIIKLLYKGNSNNDIAIILSISDNTVRFHKKNIYRKISGNKNSDIVRSGIEKKIIIPDENE